MMMGVVMGVMMEVMMGGGGGEAHLTSAVVVYSVERRRYSCVFVCALVCVKRKKVIKI